jgi:hypothetical protein
MLDFLVDVHIREEGQRHEGTLLRRTNCLCACHASGGTPVGEIIRKMGVTEQTFDRQKKRYAGLEAPEIHQFRQLEEEHHLPIPLGLIVTAIERESRLRP